MATVIMALLSACAISAKAEEASCVVTAVCEVGEKLDSKSPSDGNNKTDIEGHRNDTNNSDGSKHTGSSGNSKDSYTIQPAYMPVIDKEAIPTYVIDETHDDSEDTATDKSNVGKLPSRNAITNLAETTELIRYNLVYIKDADRVTKKSVYSFFIEEIDNRT